MRWRGWALTLKMLGGYLISTASSGRCGFLSGYCFRVDFRIAARRWIPSFANSTSQYVLNSGWLCYCTPWVLNPGQIRGWPRIRCLQTETFVEPSQSFGVPSPCLTLLFVPFCTARLCPSYPQQLLVPAWITDKELENVAAFRSWKRFPAVVYRFVF